MLHVIIMKIKIILESAKQKAGQVIRSVNVSDYNQFMLINERSKHIP